MSVDWSTGDYAGPRNLSIAIDLNGGLASFITDVGTDVRILPKELRQIARALQAVHDTCQCLFADAGVEL